MGFETFYVHQQRACNQLIIKQSLWDLKLKICIVKNIKTPNNKAVPMGFETMYMKDE